MLRKINCHDLTLNSYANLGQHKIKLDHNKTRFVLSLKYYKLLFLKKKSLYIQKSDNLEKGH